MNFPDQPVVTICDLSFFKKKKKGWTDKHRTGTSSLRGPRTGGFSQRDQNFKSFSNGENKLGVRNKTGLFSMKSRQRPRLLYRAAERGGPSLETGSTENRLFPNALIEDGSQRRRAEPLGERQRGRKTRTRAKCRKQTELGEESLKRSSTPPPPYSLQSSLQ